MIEQPPKIATTVEVEVVAAAPSMTAPARTLKTTADVSRKKNSRGHFAFMRGWCQGLELKALWEQYLTHLGEHDERRTKTFLRDLQTELGAVAKRRGNPNLAGLLRRHT